jgi:hypothetical protein
LKIGSWSTRMAVVMNDAIHVQVKIIWKSRTRPDRSASIQIHHRYSNSSDGLVGENKTKWTFYSPISGIQSPWMTCCSTTGYFWVIHLKNCRVHVPIAVWKKVQFFISRHQLEKIKSLTQKRVRSGGSAPLESLQIVNIRQVKNMSVRHLCTVREWRWRKASLTNPFWSSVSDRTEHWVCSPVDLLWLDDKDWVVNPSFSSSVSCWWFPGVDFFFAKSASVMWCCCCLIGRSPISRVGSGPLIPPTLHKPSASVWIM